MKKAMVIATMVAGMAMPAVSMADWADDWFDQSTSTSSGSYKNQQRGFYTAGGFSGRWRMSNDPLVTATPPRMEVGCGGIDLFGGGLSFLDAEYIVEKFERIIQAAPAFAFDMAMSQYCQQCKDTMNTLTAIADQLNSMQINDCRMAKRLVMAVGEDKNVMREMASEAGADFLLGEGLSKNSQDMQEDVQAAQGKAPDNLEMAIKDCPQVFQDVFTDGSVLRNATELVGMHEFADLMRGLVGDVRITYNETQRQFQVDEMTACSANEQVSGADFFAGNVLEKDADDNCSPSGMRPVRESVADRLQAIATKIENTGGNPNLSAEEIAFINAAGFPVLRLLSDSVVKRNTEAMVDVLAEPVGYAVSYRMLIDLWDVLRFAISKANEVEADASTSSGAGTRCQAGLVKEGTEAVKRLEPRIGELALEARNGWRGYLKELQGQLAATRAFQADYERRLNRLSLTQE